MEDYFRSTYIALLSYSSKKEDILRKMQLRGSEIVSISMGEMTVEEAIAKSHSFQDMKRISEIYKNLNPKIDIYGILNKPYRRRKETTYKTFERLIQQRHDLIHKAKVNSRYNLQLALKDVRTVHLGIERIYRTLIGLFNWNKEHPDL